MRLVLVDPPAKEPLTAVEAKSRLNIGDEVSNDVVDAFIAAARQQIDGADGWLGRALITQTWRGTLDSFPYREIEVPLPPLQEIVSVSYLDGEGEFVELDPDQYEVLQGQRPVIVPAHGTNWPSVPRRPGAVTIEFVAGYGDDAEDVPEPIRSAIALGVSELRSLSARNLFVSEDSVDGIGTKRYVVGEAAGKALSSAAQRLLSTYRIIVL